MNRWISLGTILLAFLAGACGVNQSSRSTSITGGGSPELNEKIYDLEPAMGSGISGTATFSETEDGFTEVTVEIKGPLQQDQFAPHIYTGSIAEEGELAAALEIISSENSTSITKIRRIGNDVEITYSDLIAYDGHITILADPEDRNSLVAWGGIGPNEIISRTSYSLDEVENSGIDGIITFNEREDGSVLAIIRVGGTEEGSVYTTHIHEGSAEDGGNVVITLSEVDGSTGISYTQIEELSYDDLLSYDGHVNIHYSEAGGIAAQGNIGSNATN